MVLRYLELSSLYRVRSQYPQPAEFVAISGAGTEEGRALTDPYLPAFPLYRFTVNTISNYTTTLTGSSNVEPEMRIGAVGTLLGPDNNLTGYYAVDTTVNPDLSNGSIVTSLDTSAGLVQLLYPWNCQVSAGDTVTFFDFSPFYPVTGTVDPLYYNIKSVGLYEQTPVTANAYYVGFYLMNDGAPAGVIDAAKIVRFFTETVTLQIEKPLTSVTFPVATTTAFSIRKSLPSVRGVIGALVGPTSITLDAFAGSTTDQWTGSFLYLYPDASDAAYPDVSTNKMTFSEYVFEIVTYDGATNVATLNRVVDTTLINLNTPSRFYEIMGNPTESSNPLQYAGSTVSQSEPRCMQVSLTTLVLPNVPLRTGSQIAFYPYVYVELRPVTHSVQVGRNIIYSNNPNSSSAIFICPISDIARPGETPFIKLNAGGMTQTIKARLNDSFYLRIYLPDGTLFEPLQQDFLPPLPPNPALQLDALFSFRD